MEFEAVFLLSAARRGQLEKVKEMIEIAGYPVNIAGDEGYTALHLACLKGHEEIVRYLVAAGADVFQKNQFEVSPLALATENGKDSLKDALMGRQLIAGECPVCLEDPKPLYAFPCDHRVCVICAETWLAGKIKDNAPFACTTPNCRENPPTWVDAQYLLKRAQQRQYDDQCLRRCLHGSPDFFFCVGCDAGGWADAQCTGLTCVHCTESWCRLCLLPPHSTMSCAEWRVLFEREQLDTIKWKEKNCKQCPSCRTHIYRDGGCSHMTCRRCTYQFCWICLGKYQPGKYTHNVDAGVCPCEKPATA